MVETDFENDFDNQRLFLKRLFVYSKIDFDVEHDDKSFVHLIENHVIENYFVKTFCFENDEQHSFFVEFSHNFDGKKFEHVTFDLKSKLLLWFLKNLFRI